MFQKIIYFKIFMSNFYIIIYYLAIFFYDWLAFYPSGLLLSIIIIYYISYTFFKLLFWIDDQVVMFSEFYYDYIVFFLSLLHYTNLLRLSFNILTYIENYLIFYSWYYIHFLNKKFLSTIAVLVFIYIYI